MPRHDGSGLVLGHGLRVDLINPVEGLFDPLLGGHGRVGEGLRGRNVGAQQHTLSPGEIVVVRVTDRNVRLVGVGYAAVDLFVVLPETAFELQTDLHRRMGAHVIDGRLQRRANLHRDLAQDRQGNGADAPVGLR